MKHMANFFIGTLIPAGGLAVVEWGSLDPVFQRITLVCTCVVSVTSAIIGLRHLYLAFFGRKAGNP